MALCVTGMVSSVAYRGVVTALRSLTGQTALAATVLSGEPALRQTLYRLDVVTVLETTGLLVELLADQEPQTAVWRIVIGLQSTLTDLQVALADARQRLEHYRGRWWYSWRAYDAGPEIRQIEMAVGVLRDQLEMLHQVTGIPRCLGTRD